MLKQKYSIIIQKLKLLPKRYFVIGGGVIVMLLLAVMLWPRTVEFSYGQKTCFRQPMLAPGLIKSVGSGGFVLAPDASKIGPISIAARVCATALTAPAAGDHRVMLSLFGLPIGKVITLRVANHPTASVASLNKPIPVSKPLELPLSTPDTVFAYKVEVNAKTLSCDAKGQKISCDITKLNLEQGRKYKLAIARYFGDQKVKTIAAQEVETLAAVAVKDTSIKREETVYAKPRSLDVTLDKDIEAAVVTLVKIENDKKVQIPIEAEANGKLVKVSWGEDLARTASYELIIDQVQAKDGSSLVDPYVLPFKTSGGPKVKSINVNKTGVALGATAVITFDQPLSEKQDIAKSVTVSSGVTIAKRQANQLFIALANVPRCADFTIKVTDELQSSHDVQGGSAWNFGGRMICHTVQTIGYSAKGRAINAYTFGSGPTAVIYTGAIHGNELGTRSLMLKWIDELEVNARSIPADKTVVVVPTINPDGVAAGIRMNGRNVDLNRNFGTSDWQKDITTVSNTPFPGGGGGSAMSEPESRAIAGLVGRLRPQLVLSYHSIGGLLQANQAGDSNARARQYSALSGYSNETGSSTTFEYAITGTADDYYAQQYGVGSIVIELGSHLYHQFERNQTAMWAMLK